MTVYGTNLNGTTQTINWTVSMNVTGGLSLSGYVNNSLGYTPVGSRIDLSNNYTFTDSSGYYTFTNITEGNYTLLARQIGYRNNTQNITVESNLEVNITMQEKMLPAIKVSPGVDSIGLIGLISIVFLWRSKKR